MWLPKEGHRIRQRLEAEDCDSIRCAQFISGGIQRRRIRPPHCLAHTRPTLCYIRLVIRWSILGINGTHNAVRKCEIALGFALHYFTLPDCIACANNCRTGNVCGHDIFAFSVVGVHLRRLNSTAVICVYLCSTVAVVTQ